MPTRVCSNSVSYRIISYRIVSHRNRTPEYCSLFSCLAQRCDFCLGHLSTIDPSTGLVTEFTLCREFRLHWFLQCRSNRTGSSVHVLKVRHAGNTPEVCCWRSHNDYNIITLECSL